jgi:hypothetical protein
MPTKSTQTMISSSLTFARSCGLMLTRSLAESVLIFGGSACTEKAVRWRVPTRVTLAVSQPSPWKPCVLTFQLHAVVFCHRPHSQPDQTRMTPVVAPPQLQDGDSASAGHATTVCARCAATLQSSALSVQPSAAGPEMFHASGSTSSDTTLKPGTHSSCSSASGGAGFGRLTIPADE